MPRLTSEELGHHAGLDPREHQWGVRTSMPVPFSISAFTWFATETELRERIADGSHYSGSQPDLWDGLEPIVRTVLERIPQLTPDATDALNAVTTPGICVEWVGRFEDLLIGDNAVALEVRRAWSESRDSEEQNEDPIEPDDVEDFADFLKEYGF